MAASLIDLTGSYTEQKLNEQEQTSFDDLQEILSTTPILAILELDERASFYIESNALEITMGAIFL